MWALTEMTFLYKSIQYSLANCWVSDLLPSIKHAIRIWAIVTLPLSYEVAIRCMIKWIYVYQQYWLPIIG